MATFLVNGDTVSYRFDYDYTTGVMSPPYLPAREDAAAAVKRAEQTLQEAYDRANKLANRPKDDFPEGMVLAFRKAYGKNDKGQNRTVNGKYVKVYNYAVIKGGGKWWITGDRTGCMSWETLLDFVEQGEKDGYDNQLRWASEMTEIEPW